MLPACAAELWMVSFTKMRDSGGTMRQRGRGAWETRSRVMGLGFSRMFRPELHGLGKVFNTGRDGLSSR